MGCFPSGTSDKEPAADAGDVRDVRSIPGLRRSPGGGHGNSFQDPCLENPHGQRSLDQSMGLQGWTRFSN